MEKLLLSKLMNCKKKKKTFTTLNQSIHSIYFNLFLISKKKKLIKNYSHDLNSKILSSPNLKWMLFGSKINTC